MKNKKKPKIKQYPLGGLINKSVTGLATSLGANERDAQLIGSGVTTATGFIPGMQSNLLYAGDFAGDLAQYSDNEDIQKAGKYASMGTQMAAPIVGQFANGGVVELEKQEVFKTPNGQVNSVNGNSHEKGGVKINVPNQTKILSDKLKMNGKTFADLGSKYKTVKEDRIISDDKATAAAKATAKLTSEIKQRKLDELYNSQEQMKQVKLAKYAERLGVTLPQQEFKYGGMTKYEDGGEYDNSSDIINNQFNDAYAGLKSNSLYDPNYVEELPYDPSEATNQYNFDRAFTTMENTRTKPINETSNPNIPYGDIASGIAQSAGAIYGLATNKRPKGVNYVKPTVKYLDPKAELRTNAIANANSRNMLKDAVGGNAGAYLANINQIGGSNAERDANTLTKYENANAGIYNQNQSEVANIKNREIDATAQDMAKYRDINTAYVGQLGSNAANMYRDNKLMQQDYKTLGIISNSYPDYKYDKKTGEWKHKSTGTRLTQQQINKVI